MRFLDCCATLVLGFAALTGCAAPGADARESGEAESGDAKGGDAKSLAALERALAVAQGELEQLDLDAKSDRQELEEAVAAAAEEREEAKQQVGDWGVTATLAVEKAKLEIQSSEMRLAEQQEELTQLELMYAEQDLADKTRELVLARTQRRIAQSKLALELERRELEALGTVTQPAKRRELEAAVVAKERALAGAQRKARVEWNGKQVELLKAKHAVADATDALEKAKQGAKK